MRPDSDIDRLREAMRNEPPDTPLGKAVARLKEPIVIGDGEQYFYEQFIVMMVTMRQALHEIDPDIPPSVPGFMMDPAVIASMFRIPLAQMNFQGGQGVDPRAVKQLEEAVELIKAGPVRQDRDLSMLHQTEKKIVQVLGHMKLTGEEIASRAHYPFNSNLKQTLASLVKCRILGNDHPGYYRL